MKKTLLLMLAFVACFTGAKADELTAADGTVTNEYLPIYGFYWDTGFKNTMVYPASMLTDMVGGTITAVTFYADKASYDALTGGNVKVSIGETEVTTLSGHLSGLTEVFSGIQAKNEDKWVFTFDTPYDYEGGNLALEFHLTQTGQNCPHINFLGIEQTAASYNAYNSSLSNAYVRNFLPKATFNYDPATLEDYAASVNPKQEDGLNFRRLAVGGSKTLNVTLRNKGLKAFTPSVTVTGTGFSTTYTAAELAAGTSATIPVVFNPATAGDFTGTLAIDCGQAGTFNLPLTGTSANELTFCDGETAISTLPVYGLQHDHAQTNQMLYPAEKLEAMNGKTITSMTFYPKGGILFYNGSVTFALANMPASSEGYTSNSCVRKTPDGLTTVSTITLPDVAQADLTEWTVTFDTPFTYNGGDLLIDVNTEAGAWKGTTFYAEDLGYGNYQSYYSYGSTSSGVYFLPKVTFVFAADEPASNVITFTAQPEGGTVEVTLADGTPVESGVTEVAAGEPITVTANAADGYVITAFTVTADGEPLELDVENGDETGAGAPARAQGPKQETHTFVMPEKEVAVNVSFEVKTGINDINATTVKGVRYVNMQGIESDTPFDGVNIVVTEMNDGSKAITKEVK